MQTSQLSENEVRARLKLCEAPEVVDEVYSFGQILQKETVEHIRTVESKATSFAAYGAAIVTLLVSSSSTWSQLGNRWTACIAVFAGICALICTVFSVQAISLKRYECISEDEWLKSECFSRIYTLKRYRILTLWGTIHYHAKAQKEKAARLQSAQVWLTGSVVYLVYLLLHVAFVLNLSKDFWIAVGKFSSGIGDPLGIPGWQGFTSSPSSFGGWLCGLILGLTFVTLIWRGRRV
jgi:hypothetical protein